MLLVVGNNRPQRLLFRRCTSNAMIYEVENGDERGSNNAGAISARSAGARNMHKAEEIGPARRVQRPNGRIGNFLLRNVNTGSERIMSCVSLSV